MVSTIDQRINEIIQYTQAMAAPSYEPGSDDYLDKVLEIKEKFDGLSSLLSVLSEDIIKSTNTNAQYSIRELAPRLKSISISCRKTHDKYVQSKFGKALKTTLENFRMEMNQLKEIVDDYELIQVTIKEDEELQSLFSQL